MSIDLKPCPFCGGAANLEDERLLWVARCTGCGACVLGDRAPEPEQEMPWAYWEPFRQSAVDRWNRRATPEPGEVEELMRRCIRRLMTDSLSPAAQAVLAAYFTGLATKRRNAIAAALRAAADQVVPKPPMIVAGGRSYEEAWTVTVHDDVRRRFLAIAAEMEGQ